MGNVFDASMIETLRLKYADNKGLENQKQPSSIETLGPFGLGFLITQFSVSITHNSKMVGLIAKKLFDKR